MRKANILLFIVLVMTGSVVCVAQGNRISGKIATTANKLHLYENLHDPVFAKVVDSCVPGGDGSFVFNRHSNRISYYWIQEVGLEFVLLPGQDIHFEQVSADSISVTGEGAKAYYLGKFLHPMHTEFSNRYATFDDPMAFHNYAFRWKNETLLRLTTYGQRNNINAEIIDVFRDEIVYKYTLYHYFFTDEDNIHTESFRLQYPDYFDFENNFCFSDSNNFSLSTLHFLIAADVRSRASTDPSLKIKGRSYQYCMFLAIKKYLRGKSSAYALVSLSKNLYYWLRAPTDLINEYYKEIEIVKEYLLSTSTDSAFYLKFCENINNYSGFVPGDTFKNIELFDTLGNAFLLNNYKDKVVYINIWGIGCGPCIEQLTWYNALCDSFNDNKDVLFLNICKDVSGSDERILRWKEILRKKEVVGISLYSREVDGVSDEMGTMVPQHYILGKNNIIITLGAKGPKYVEGDLQRILEWQKQ